MVSIPVIDKCLQVMRSVACRRGKNKARVETTSSSQPLLAASARPTTTPVNTRRHSTSPQALPTKRPAGSQQEDRSPYPKMARTTEESSAKRQLVYGSIDEMEQELDKEMANMLDAARTCDEDMAIETPRRFEELPRDAYQLRTSPPTAISATDASSLSSFKWATNMRNWRPTIGNNDAQHGIAHKPRNTPVIDPFGFVDEADDGAREPRADETSRAAEKVYLTASSTFICTSGDRGGSAPDEENAPLKPGPRRGPKCRSAPEVHGSPHVKKGQVSTRFSLLILQ